MLTGNGPDRRNEGKKTNPSDLAQVLVLLAELHRITGEGCA